MRFVRGFDRGLWILSLGWLVSAMGFAISIPFIAIYFSREFGWSTLDIGLYFGGLAIVRSIFQAAGGELSDRMPRIRVLIDSQLLRSCAYVLLAASIYLNWGPWWVSVALYVSAIFGAVFQPAANAAVSDILPKSQRLDGYAITRSAGNLGWAIGPAIGGFLAGVSYGLLFLISAVLTASSALIFWAFLHLPKVERATDRFRFRDIVAVKDDRNLGYHMILIFILYLVVAQLMAPFSVYAVEIVGLSESQLGFLYTLNGLLVVLLQIPATRLLSRFRLTTQLLIGALFYAVGYGTIGTFVSFNYFLIAIAIVTFGEICMSPPSLALTSHLAPEGRMGRYMGVFGFAVASGWSFGPLYGGAILDLMSHSMSAAWIVISSLAIVAGLGYWAFGRRLPDRFNWQIPPEATE